MPQAAISGVDVTFAVANGYDDLLLYESTPGLALAVTLLSRRAGVDAAALPVGDVDALVAELRRAAIGDALVAEGRCATCATPVDVDFSLAALLQHARPRASRAAVAERDGWWRLRASDTRFRIPTAADVLAAGDLTELVARCIAGASPAADVRRVERALEALAPTLRTTGLGSCPECGAEVVVDVDARALCLEELRFLAGSVLEDVHLLASAYRWSEESILALPSPRRRTYAQMIQSGRSAELSVELADA
jgi:hypothetical protein